jgi:hypothetical protein
MRILMEEEVDKLEKIIENWCIIVWRIDAAADRDNNKVITSSGGSSCMRASVCVKARSH